ncbi:ankyrin repeat domain-containing protein [Stenotrophomonas maltophilia]|nr:ankyrin repeat domain-containing protein [Stenotrophomonas maltophilia]
MVSGEPMVPCDFFGSTELHKAVILDDQQTIARLVEEGWDINVVNPRGESPLHFAVWCESPLIKKSGADGSTISLLLRLGADAGLRTDYGMSAKDIALFTARPDLGELIDIEDQRVRISSEVTRVGADVPRTRKI